MLTAIVLTKNEESVISRCLNSLRFCNQILVVDDESIDKTVKISKTSGAKVLTHSMKDDFSSQRNWALSQVKSGWVLFVDADEIVSSELAEEIINAITADSVSGFYIPRSDYMWGQKLHYGDVRGLKLLRLAKHDVGHWSGRVHEQWVINGSTLTLKHSLTHFPHQVLVEFLHHINLYSTIKSQEFITNKKNITLFHIIFAPIYRFLFLYFFKLGFLDGVVGTIHALLMSFYVFMVASKTWLIKSKQVK